jgi:hypothetical protein
LRSCSTIAITESYRISAGEYLLTRSELQDPYADPSIRRRHTTRKTGSTPNERAQHYWIVANLDGHTVIIGPKDSLVEANEFAYSKLDVPFQVVPLQTVDKARATSQIKAMKLDATASLKDSIQRAKHQL